LHSTHDGTLDRFNTHYTSIGQYKSIGIAAIEIKTGEAASSCSSGSEVACNQLHVNRLIPKDTIPVTLPVYYSQTDSREERQQKTDGIVQEFKRPSMSRTLWPKRRVLILSLSKVGQVESTHPLPSS
jgi:hypothetical protein